MVWTGWTNSPVTIHTLISHSSVTLRQSHPSYLYSFLLRILLDRTSVVVVYILRLCDGEYVEAWGMGRTWTDSLNDTPLLLVLLLLPEDVDVDESDDDEREELLLDLVSPGTFSLLPISSSFSSSSLLQLLLLLLLPPDWILANPMEPNNQLPPPRFLAADNEVFSGEMAHNGILTSIM